MLNRLFATLVPIAIGLSVAACGSKPAADSATKEAWNAANDPLRFSDDYETRLDDLPLSGESSTKPWSDFYWPNHEGGLAYRWSDPSGGDGFGYTPPTSSGVAAMSRGQLAQLSPAEKYDIFVGNYDFDLVAYERERTSPDDETWFGLCHGWAAAAMNFAEPRPVTLTGPSGVAVPFGSADIKALLTFAQQYDRGAESVRFLGGRCNRVVDGGNRRPDDVECRDVNAGAFHIVLANELGMRGTPFIADTTRDREVWNYPVHGYSSRILSQSRNVPAVAAPGTVRIVRVETVVERTAGSQATWEPPLSPEGATERYRYSLEIDAGGSVIGGEWISTERPDFLWTQTAPVFEGYFADLEGIYGASIR